MAIKISGSVLVVGDSNTEISETEFGYLDGLTTGTVAASKAVVVDSNKDISEFRNLQAVQLSASSNIVIGNADLDETDLEKLDGITNGTVSANKAVVVDSDKDVSGFRHVTATGAVTAGTSFIIGSADLNETDLEKLDGITNGTVAANKAVVVDDNKDASEFRNLQAVQLSASSNIVIGNADLNETDLEKLDGITDGTAAANKALVLDGNLNIGTINQITASYAKIDILDVNEINSVTRTETTLEVVDKLILAASGSNAANSDAGGLQIGGTSGSDTVASILYDNSNSALDFNIGGTTEIRLEDGVLRPETDDDVDLGASGAEFRDLYLDGVAYIDNLQATLLGAPLDCNNRAMSDVHISNGVIQNASIGTTTAAAGVFTTLHASGNVQLGDAASDVVTCTAQLTASEGATFSKAAAGPIFSASVGLYGDEMTVGGSGGTATFLNGATMSAHLGGTTATFSSTLTVQGAAILSGAVSLGESDGDVISFNGRIAEHMIPNSDNAVDLGSSAAEFKDLYLDGVAYVDELRADTLGAAMNCNSQAMTNVDINSGNIDGTVIGAASKAAGSFTNLVAAGDVDLGDAATDTVTVTGRFDSDLLPISDSASDLGSATLQWAELHVDSGYVDTLAAAVTASAGVHISAKTGPYSLSIADGAGDAIAQAWVTHSDRNLKTNIQELDSNAALNAVMSLQPSTYEKKASGKSEIGFIAQEVAQVVPEICALDANGIGRGIDYSRMSTLLAGALKAQQEQIAQLKEIVAKLQK